MLARDKVSEVVASGALDQIGETLAFGNELGLSMLKDQATMQGRYDSVMNEIKLLKVRMKVDQQEQQASFYLFLYTLLG
jgi:hypothetical protein